MTRHFHAFFKKQKNVCSIRTIYDIMRHTNNELWKETEKRYELIRCTERTTAAGCDGNRRSNLATMLAEGSGQGVLDCKRAERDYPEASPGAFKLCHELGAFQSDAEETWRGFV